MRPEFEGIERRLTRLEECLQKLEPLRHLPTDNLLADGYLRDAAERNLEVAAQCCIDISNRVILLENALRPATSYESLLRLGEIGVLPIDFARSLAPLSGFRNILVHEYLDVDWNEVIRHLQHLGELTTFATLIRQWMKQAEQAKQTRQQDE